MYSLFDDINAREAHEQMPRKRATVLATNRALKEFGVFLADSNTKEQFDARLKLVEENFWNIVRQACKEEGYPQASDVLVDAKRRLFADIIQDRYANDHGDTYHQETVTLPTADEDGLADEPSGPKIDKNLAPPEHIEVPSVEHKHEQQDVEQAADYDAERTTPGVLKTVDAETPMQPEHNTGDHTDVFPNKNQANPVTSKWRVVE